MKVVLFVLLLLVSLPAFAQDSLLSTLQALRLAYPAGWTHADRGAFLNAVAFKHKDQGWGLLSKPGGNRCPTPQQVDVSCDYLVYRPTMQGFDVLADENTPVWQQGDSFLSEPERWVAPSAPTGPVPVPVPPPVVVVPPPTQPGSIIIDPEIIRRLAVIEQKQDHTIAAVNDAKTTIVDVLKGFGKWVSGPLGTAIITYLLTRPDEAPK